MFSRCCHCCCFCFSQSASAIPNYIDMARPWHQHQQPGCFTRTTHKGSTGLRLSPAKDGGAVPSVLPVEQAIKSPHKAGMTLLAVVISGQPVSGIPRLIGGFLGTTLRRTQISVDPTRLASRRGGLQCRASLHASRSAKSHYSVDSRSALSIPLIVCSRVERLLRTHSRWQSSSTSPLDGM